jgi:hypothetical protein
MDSGRPVHVAWAETPVRVATTDQNATDATPEPLKSISKAECKVWRTLGRDERWQEGDQISFDSQPHRWYIRYQGGWTCNSYEAQFGFSSNSITARRRRDSE